MTLVSAAGMAVGGSGMASDGASVEEAVGGAPGETGAIAGAAPEGEAAAKAVTMGTGRLLAAKALAWHGLWLECEQLCGP